MREKLGMEADLLSSPPFSPGTSDYSKSGERRSNLEETDSDSIRHARDGRP